MKMGRKLWTWFGVVVLAGICLTLVPVSVAEDDFELDLAGLEEEEESLGQTESVPQDTPTVQVTYKPPEPTGEHFLAETFHRGSLEGWVRSSARKDGTDEDIAKYDGEWQVEEMKDKKLPGDLGLVLKSRAKHHAISAPLLRPFTFDTKPLIVQYEVNFQSGIDCGGAYIKLLTQTDDLDLDQFVDKTPYTIMFGPDKCGEDYKLHFIFRHKNPKTGEYEEKHSKKPETDLRSYFTDKKTHLYTLVVNPDNSFEVLVDQTVVNSGSLLTDFSPPVNPPAEIEDPDDHKPDDWDERPKIQDPDAHKPEDWDEDAPAQILDEDAVKPDGWLDDEPEYIGDPDAVKPEDWDEDMDGEWEAPQIQNPACETAPGCGAWKRPMIENPNYKGKWKAPMIDNPSYQGVWKPRKIANPDFFEDLHPFRMRPFSAVGLELWSMTSDIFFDNFFITNDRNTAERWAADGWALKRAAEGAAEPGLAAQMISAAEERPWLWIVYVLTGALPLVLIIVFCCTGKKKSSPPAADYKKTDEAQPDVKDQDEASAEDQDLPAEDQDLPAEDQDVPAEDQDLPAEDQEGSAEVQGPSAENETAEQNLEDDVLRRSPRNRKVRKD